MLSFDTNLAVHAANCDSASHAQSRGFIESLAARRDVAICELMLLELYTLLRNPAVLAKPLTAHAAVDVCEAFRHHPHWQLIGLPPDSRAFHDAFWPRLREKSFARRRAFDWRAALALTRQGVTQFATVN